MSKIGGGPHNDGEEDGEGEGDKWKGEGTGAAGISKITDFLQHHQLLVLPLASCLRCGSPSVTSPDGTPLHGPGAVLRPLMPLWWLSLLALHLSAGVRLAGAAVSDSFRECSQFFYMRTAPAGIRGGNLRRICQRYDDEPRYATLYDASRRLAVFSAYTFKKTDGRSRVDTPWMYEPQLASANENGNMRTLALSDEADPLIEESQALLPDYTDAVEYERGPLNPDQHQSSSPDKASTYTLTNVVPLAVDFLEGPWTGYTHAVRRRLNNFCLGPAYVVTGVTVSGGLSIRRGRDARLAVPDRVWSAYCCPRYDRHAPYEVRYMLPAYAAYGLNRSGQAVLEVPLKTLESLLKSHADVESDLALFHGDCVTENTAKKKK
ncbi:endonuclease domain-containing 1 protein-like [Sardina pilchardus]|uniref:endonuclease domain-containing 1 protein-like n=1 Tax=Sardina pilchardus TaxID=27697 RepID=UPI002E0E6B6F